MQIRGSVDNLECISLIVLNMIWGNKNEILSKKQLIAWNLIQFLALKSLELQKN